MEKIKALLQRITDLTRDELEELRSLILALFEAKQHEAKTDPSKVHSTDDFDELAVLASAATKVKAEEKRREDNVLRAHEAQQVLASFRTEPRRSSALGLPSDRMPQGWRVGGGTGRAVTASGMAISDSDGLSREFLNVLRTYGGSTGIDGEKVRIATLRVEPEPNSARQRSPRPSRRRLRPPPRSTSSG